MSFRVPAPEQAKFLDQMRQSTPARLGVWRSGTRPLTETWLEFRRDHAMARDAVHSELSETFLGSMSSRGCPIIQSLADSRRQFILNPPRGKRCADEAISTIKATCAAGQDVQIVISDGLSARAVEVNVPQLLPMLELGFKQENISQGLPVVARFGRVAIGDQIGHAVNAKLVINLIGERPGLSCSDGLSAYMTFNPGPDTISSDRTVVSNIHDAGTPAVEAGAYIVQLARRILDAKVSGVRLQLLG